MARLSLSVNASRLLDPSTPSPTWAGGSTSRTDVRLCMNALNFPTSRNIRKQLSAFVGLGHHRKLYKSSSPL
jgi:hypothetical protein